MRRELALLLALCACVELELGSETSVVAPRLIAVTSEPAESAPGQSVRFTAHIAGADDARLRWSFCSTPRAPVDNTSASPACASTLERPLVGDGLAIDAIIPADACRVFGSETPAGSATAAADASGGYYQPLRVAFAEQVMVVRQRLRCALPAAPIESARAFAQDYRANQPPTAVALRAFVAGLEQPLAGLARSDEVQLRLEFTPAETYLLYQPSTGTLASAFERQTVSWFVSAGSMVPAQSAGTSTWRVPADIAAAQIWAVLRDDRGASAVFTATLAFAP